MGADLHAMSDDGQLRTDGGEPDDHELQMTADDIGEVEGVIIGEADEELPTREEVEEELEEFRQEWREWVKRQQTERCEP